jgi:GntR family transcriptional regulator
VPVLDDGTPLFVQIAEQLADDIVDGVLAEGARAPSTNELATFYRINPATAAKGINLLVDETVLEKRRGIGMFVAAGARDQLRARRRKQFAEQYLEPMLAEAGRLGIDTDALVSLIRGSGWHNGGKTS